MAEILSLPRDVSSLLGWLNESPPGTLVPACELAEQIRSLPITARPEQVVEDSLPLLTADKVAEWLQVDKQRVYRMARDGRLQCVRLGGNTVRFRRSDMERWIDRRTG